MDLGPKGQLGYTELFALVHEVKMEVETVAIGCMPQGPSVMSLGIVSGPKVGGSRGQRDEPAPRDQHPAHLQGRQRSHQ